MECESSEQAGGRGDWEEGKKEKGEMGRGERGGQENHWRKDRSGRGQAGVALDIPQRTQSSSLFLHTPCNRSQHSSPSKTQPSRVVFLFFVSSSSEAKREGERREKRKGERRKGVRRGREGEGK